MIGSCHERGEKVATYISNFVHLIGRDAYDISSFVTHRARLTLVFFNLDAKMDKIGNRDVKVRCQSHLGHVTRIVTRLVSMGYMSLSSVTWHVTECHYLMHPQPETKKGKKCWWRSKLHLESFVCIFSSLIVVWQAKGPTLDVQSSSNIINCEMKIRIGDESFLTREARR